MRQKGKGEMRIEKPELFHKTLQDIKNLRESLKGLETANPHLFDRYNGCINMEWEFWSTDEILERVSEDISSVLGTCKNPLQVVGNPDEVENEK
jgi:hypothetical protein